MPLITLDYVGTLDADNEKNSEIFSILARRASKSSLPFCYKS
jgi:hypothetical protein